jgi:TolB-like protein/DNA-binding winged helix-turn-helix (wHTH) protein/Tfp pilus assembly protein PilF
MQHAATPLKVVRFGKCEVDLRSGELWKNGSRTKLPEQPRQILAMLLENAGEVVTREALRSTLWPCDTFVDFEHSLNTAVMRLREALGDSSGTPRYVETLLRRGYRFIAPIEEIAAPTHTDRLGNKYPLPPGPTQEQISSVDGFIAGMRGLGPQLKKWGVARTLIAIALIANCVVGIADMSLRLTRRPKAVEERVDPTQSIAVLPLENVSGDEDQDYFADGMTDELIAQLAKVGSLRVLSRTTAMAYRGTHKPLSEIARDLHVSSVVEGTVLRSGNRVRITAELVQTSTDRHLWAETYETEIGDILGLQNRVASAIVKEVSIKLTPEEQQRLTTVRPVLAESYEDYLKGNYYYSNNRSAEGLAKAIEYFQRAIQADPNNALAYAGLSNCYATIGSSLVGAMPSLEAAAKSRAAALKALEIDDNLAEAQVALANVRIKYDWDWEAAEEGFQRAIELKPSYSTAYQRYSLYLMAMGRTRESVALVNRARELDPLSVSTNFSLGWRLYMARQYDKAIVQLLNTIDLDPTLAVAHLILGQAYEEKQLYPQALNELQKANLISNKAPLMLAAVGHAYARTGRRADAEVILAQLFERSKKENVSPFVIASIYEALGDKEKALDWLDKAYQDRSNALVFLKVDPELDTLRSHPRFKELQRKLNLPL